MSSAEAAIAGSPSGVTTMLDVLAAQRSIEEEAARRVKKAVCTRDQHGDKPVKQPVYACTTCQNALGRQVGLCHGCQVRCHGHHDVVELGSKFFVCDCATTAPSEAVKGWGPVTCEFHFTPAEESQGSGPAVGGTAGASSGAGSGSGSGGGEGVASSQTGGEAQPRPLVEPLPRAPTNRYNHNFEGKFCVCDGPYVMESDTMFQCCACEDWLHAQHVLGLPAQASFADTFDELICAPCTKSMPFLVASVLKNSAALPKSQAPTPAGEKCSLENTGDAAVLQMWTSCLTCGGGTDGIVRICLNCADNCHKGHELAPTRISSMVCQCSTSLACEAMGNECKIAPASVEVDDAPAPTPKSPSSSATPVAPPTPGTDKPETPSSASAGGPSGASASPTSSGGSDGCPVPGFLESLPSALSSTGISMFLPASFRGALCRCESCLARFRKHNVTSLLQSVDSELLASGSEDEDDEEEEEEEAADGLGGILAAAFAAAANAAGASSSRPGPTPASASATPTSTALPASPSTSASASGSAAAVPTSVAPASTRAAATGAAGAGGDDGSQAPSIHDSGMVALLQQDPTMSLNALYKYNAMSSKFRDFLRPFAEQGKVVEPADIRAFFSGMLAPKAKRRRLHPSF